MRKATGFAAALAGLVVGLAMSSNEAVAQNYPYCAMGGGRNSYENCGFTSYGQCQASVSGVGGYCTRNPRYFQERYYDDDESEPPRRSRQRRNNY